MLKNKKGLSLVELIIVILIIAILAITAGAIYGTYTRRAMATEGKLLLDAILTKQRVYFVEWGRFFPVEETDAESRLGIDARGNRYFRTFDIEVPGDGSFIATTWTSEAGGKRMTLELKAFSFGRPELREVTD